MSLVPDMNLAEISPSEDARGQVDFEIGVGHQHSSVHPFIPVLIAFKRSYMENDNANANEKYW
jgi:hypothetical protein